MITLQATIIGYIDDFKLMMILSLAAMPLVLLLRKPARRPRSTTAPSWSDVPEAIDVRPLKPAVLKRQKETGAL